MKKRKVLIAAGGTGGHIFPALALAEKLTKLNPHIELLFVGGNLDKNNYFQQSLYPFHTTSSAHFGSKNIFKLFSSICSINRGIWEGRHIIANFQPNLAIGFGSYYTFPILVAALLKKIPLLLHESNSIPGKVNRFLSRFATISAINFPVTASKMHGKTKVVGMPLRDGFKKGAVKRAEAAAYFQLDPSVTTLLVFGGSQGAQALNKVMLEMLHRENASASLPQPWQIIHITGNEESLDPLCRVYHRLGIKASVKKFETLMDLEWHDSDLALARAGAGTISEAIEFGIPLFLVPFPKAADNHQEKNADFMVQEVGGGHKIMERELSGENLQQLLKKKFDKSELEAMRFQIGLYKQRSHEIDLVDLVEKML